MQAFIQCQHCGAFCIECVGSPLCGIISLSRFRDMWLPHVPKARFPEGNGRDVYPRVRVNGRAVCVACALCVSVLCSAESGEKGDPEATHQALAVSPGAPAGLPPAPPAGAGVAGSCNNHAIVLCGPRWAFSNVAGALVPRGSLGCGDKCVGGVKERPRRAVDLAAKDTEG